MTDIAGVTAASAVPSEPARYESVFKPVAGGGFADVR